MSRFRVCRDSVQANVEKISVDIPESITPSKTVISLEKPAEIVK